MARSLAEADDAAAVLAVADARLARLRASADAGRKRSTELKKLKAEFERLEHQIRVVEASDLPQEERVRARENLAQREQELLRAKEEHFRERMARPDAAAFLFALPASDQRCSGFAGDARLVGEVEGQRLWVGEVRGRHPGGRLPYDGSVAELETEGWCVWRGPLRETRAAALDAAARLAWSETAEQCVPDLHAPGAWPGFLMPQQSYPAVTALAAGGALDAFGVREDRGADGFRAELSCRHGGADVAVSASGASADEARELAGRRLLGVLAGEAGFGSVRWPPGEAEDRLDALAGEPWLGEVRRRSKAARGGGWRAEVSCRVDGVQVRAETTAAEKDVAVCVAAWLLAQSLGSQGGELLLEARPPYAATALAGLRERGVVGAPEIADGPGAAEAVVVSAACGERRLWAAGANTEQALYRLLVAVRCWTLAPGAARAAEVGAARPGWIRKSAASGVAGPEELRRRLGEGVRLCAAGLESGRPGFVLVPRSGGRGAGDRRGRPVWRVWTERGAVQVSGPLVPVEWVARALVGREHEAGWDESVGAWGAILRFGCEAVAAGQVWPGARGDGSVVWRPGPWSDAQAEELKALAAVLPPWAHSETVGGGKGAMLPAGAAAGLVLVALADELVRSPGATAVWGAPMLTSPLAPPVEGPVAHWLDAAEEIADALPPPGVVLSVQPPPKPRVAAASLMVNVRLRSADRGRRLVTLPALQADLGAGHPAVLRAMRALRKAAASWPVLAPVVHERTDQVRISPGEASLLLGHLGRALRRAGVEVQWPQQWSMRLRPVVVTARGASAGGGMLSMQELVDYRWQVQLDGTALSAEECVRVAEAGGSLVWLRDRWVLVDALTAERARGRCVRRAVPAGEALTAVLLGSVDVGGGEHAELVAEGELGELAALMSADTLTPAQQPQDLAGDLWPYQRDGLTWLANVTSRFGAVLGDEMGLGKTVQVIALMLHRRAQGLSQGLPVLVVVPTSMMLTWVRQLERFAPTLPVRMYHGPGRALDGLEAGTVVVTSYGTLLASQDELAAQTYSLIVADEAQQVKNPASKTSLALARLLTLARVALTGTPVENRLSDLWALLHWTNPALFASPASFQQMFGALEAGPAPEAAAALNRVVGRFLLRRHKSDPQVALQLPEKIESVHTLALTPAQRGLYTSTVQIAMDQVRNAPGPERAGLVLRLLTHLRQICNSPTHLRVGAADSGQLEAALTGYQPHQASTDACKLDALDDLVPAIIDDNESTVIFTEYRTMATLLARHAAHWDMRPLLHVGTMSSGERDATLDAFRRRKSRLLIVTYKSGGTGLDLTTASHAVLFDRPFNPAPVAQAVDRLHRPGQAADVHVHRLTTAGTVEDKIEQLLARKTGLLNALRSPTAVNPAMLTDDELHALVALGASS
ncbi:SNF2-related protein [Streptomyces anulatus]|uniref:SNF2-related protein n=1 Tax=Streptomyces anulatus TaxID=1892 RepID=UPI003870C621